MVPWAFSGDRTAPLRIRLWRSRGAVSRVVEEAFYGTVLSAVMLAVMAAIVALVWR